MPDDGKKNPRDNVSPKLKPKDAKNENVAPPGHMGIDNNPSGMNLGSGVRVINVSYQMVVQSPENEPEPDPAPELSPEEQRAAYLESLPRDTVFTSLTGNEQQDNESIARGEVPVTDKELAAIQGSEDAQSQESAFDDMMQSDGTTYFQRTNDRQVNKLHEDRGETPVHSVVGDHGLEAGAVDNPFGSQKDLKRAFDQAKGREMSRGQSKGPEHG